MTCARWLLVGALAAATPAVAQEPGTLGLRAVDSLGPLRSAVAATKPATRVQVELRDGRYVTGVLRSFRPDAIEVADSSGALVGIQYADVTKYWRRGRATRTGAIVVAIPATIFGVLLGIAASGMCETPGCGDHPVATAAGVGVFVGALGAGVGAIIGAAIPQWRQGWALAAQTPVPDQPPPAPPVVTVHQDSASAAHPARARRVGEVTALLNAGYAGVPSTYYGPSDGGLAAGAVLGLGFRRGLVAFGPETGLHFGAIGSTWSLAAVSRVDLRHRRNGARVPYVVAGVGAGFWFLKGMQGDEESGLLTGILGCGTTVGDRWRVEGRWNPVLQYSDYYTVHPTLITLGVGRVVSW